MTAQSITPKGPPRAVQLQTPKPTMQSSVVQGTPTGAPTGVQLQTPNTLSPASANDDTLAMSPPTKDRLTPRHSQDTTSTDLQTTARPRRAARRPAWQDSGDWQL